MIKNIGLIISLILCFIINDRFVFASEEENTDIKNTNIRITIPLENILANMLMPQKENQEKHSNNEILVPSYHREYQYDKSKLAPEYYNSSLPIDFKIVNKLLSDSNLLSRLKSQVDQPMSLIVYGKEGVGKRTFIHWLANKNKKRLYEIDYEGFSAHKIMHSQICEFIFCCHKK